MSKRKEARKLLLKNLSDKRLREKRDRRLSLILRTYPKALYRIFAFAGSKACGRMVCLERELYANLFCSSQYWHACCIALAREKKLFLPDHNANTNWRVVFVDHIYPARFKWRIEDEEDKERRQDFKIRVSARFRPRDQTERSTKSFFVPLHQRIRLRRLNRETLSRTDIWKQDTTSEEMRRLFANGQKLSPEVMEALAAAGELSGIASRAKNRSNELPSWNDDANDNDDKTYDDANSSEIPSTTRGVTTRSTARMTQSLPSFQDDDHQDTKQILDEKEYDENVPNGQNRKQKDCRVIAVDNKHSVCALYVPGIGLRPFHFANVFSDTNDQQYIYHRVAEYSVVATLNGFNSCLLCYGQTGSGKTYTMFGPTENEESKDESKFYFYNVAEKRGVVLRACEQLLRARESFRDVKLHLSMEYCQIYQNKIACLMSGNMVRLRYGKYLEGAKSVELNSIDQVLDILREGEKRKRYASTAMNMHSSRAHTVMKITLTQRRSDKHFVSSTLMLVDLAGSEQVKQSRVQGSQFLEAVRINYSLHILGKCIDALVKGKRHVPYFECTLTTLLKEGLGGSSRTQAIMTCRSDDRWAEQSLSTLRFGERCSTITNSASLGAMSVKDALATIRKSLSQCQTQLDKMRSKGTTHLPLYKKLEERHFTLNRRLEALGSS